MNVDVYSVGDGWGYSIHSETDNVHIVQEFNPYRRGFVSMTKEEAQYFADCIAAGTEIVYEGDPPYMGMSLDEAKQDKVKELAAERDKHLYAGFSSNATGITLYFGFDPIDQAYLQEKALLLVIDPTVDAIDWKTSQGFVTLTRSQFLQVIKDGGTHKEGLVRQLMYLEAQVMNCTTIEEVAALAW
ncbi:hypothetical protein SD71_16265 [Cohnella kolymensis]|uniref:DUF4376 domain-containing protein n=1 Tax=Cohnella kolymensis TaxID=1590652 RepID=A0ABR5A277_9BACL|nr:DUF4376 domain-containing protein [Cohnella kolymensis]KIL35177.1 hypothetical protein SD71_16265 [Cohnella kolymensis]